MYRTIFVVALTVLFVGCTSSTYKAEIRRTSYGIPHITAQDWGSLGFGEGYAMAEDHMCTLADQVIRVRSERAKYFGAGPNNANLHSDLSLKAIQLQERAQADFDAYPPDVQDYFVGFTAGISSYLDETGADQVPGWCQGAEWLTPVTTLDMVAYTKSLLLIASRFTNPVAMAQPPGEPFMADLTSLEYPKFEGASNGWGIGSDRSASGGGMLLSNPHYPWVGSNRFWERHLILPGSYNAYGVGLIGGIGVTMGFNDAVAWTHTVSSGARYTLSRIKLVDGKPTEYLLDGEPRPMEVVTVSVEVKQDDGSLQTENRDYYRTNEGPLVVLPNMEWTEEYAFVLRDANRDNDEAVLQWMEMGQAGSMDEFQAIHEKYTGMPWVNTISTSAEGRAWYADVSSTPLFSDETMEAWQELKANDPMVAGAFQRGIILLDGSDSRFSWASDPAQRDQGVVAYSELPTLERADYVFNANDSYWLTNSSALLPGKSPVHALQDGTPRSPRTRMNDLVLSDLSEDGPSGADQKFSLDELGELALVNRSLTAELLVPELVEACKVQPGINVGGALVRLTEACSVLEAWDQKYDLDSRGAVLWREFIMQFQNRELLNEGTLFENGFDAADPVGTPNGLQDADRVGAILPKLANAVQILERAGFALDVPLGEVQFAYRSGDRIPIHGGLGFWEGITNFVNYASNGTTLEPDVTLTPLVEGSRALREDGYPVNRGTSFIMVLDYQEEGPRAKAFMTYGQSGDPASPHFADQTRLFSDKAWRPVLFTEEEISSDPALRTYTVSGAR